MEIRLTPIATVKNTRTAPGDDFWGGVISEIELAPEMPAALERELRAFMETEAHRAGMKQLPGIEERVVAGAVT